MKLNSSTPFAQALCSAAHTWLLKKQEQQESGHLEASGRLQQHNSDMPTHS